MSNYNFSYFNNNDGNDEMDQLDKMAREINEKKKKNFELIKNVHNDFFEETQKNKKHLDSALQNDNFRYFSTQGNIYNESEKNNTINDTISNNSKDTKDSNFTKETQNTFNDSFLKSLNKYKKNKSSSNIDDNLSVLIDHLKKEHNSHIFSENESINSNSQESIIKHLKKCSKCKSKIKLVFDDNHKIDKKNNDNIKTLTINFSNLKEYLILVLLLFLILLILYIFFKLK